MVTVTKYNSVGYKCFNFETKEEAVSFLKARTEKDIDFKFDEEYYDYGERYIMSEKDEPQESDEFCGLDMEWYYDNLL